MTQVTPRYQHVVITTNKTMVSDKELRKMDAQAASQAIADMRVKIEALMDNQEVSGHAAEDALEDANTALRRAQIDVKDALNELEDE
jgi:hypothetical protein